MRRCDCISHHQVWCLQVFAASSAGFRCTGFEINSILLTYARSKAHWRGVPSGQATFVNKDFWKVGPPPPQKKMSFIDPDQTCDIMCLSFLLLQTDLSAYNNVTAFLAPGVVGSFFLSHPAQQTRHFKRLTFHSFSDWLTDGSAGWEAVERASRWCACHRLSFSFPRLAATVVCRLRSRPDFRLWHEQRAFTLEKRTKHSCVISHSQRLMLFHSTCRSLRQ